MTQARYNKPPSTIAEHIALLQARGLVINDITLAEHFLTHIGYYRLAGYWQLFQADKAQHIFAPASTFEQIIELYDFDRELRILLYDAIERIEISFRTVITNEMCLPHGAFWFDDETLIRSADRHEENLRSISDELDRTKETFIKDHDRRFGDGDLPPAWKTFQVLSFGTLSKVYTNLKSSIPEKNGIARKFGLPNYLYLESWIQTISVLRNLCAHHSRIVNRTFDFPPKKVTTSKHPWIKQLPADEKEQSLLYTQLCAVKFLMDRCSPGNRFTERLQALIIQYPGVNVKAMGFPANWQSEELWASPGRER